MIFLKNLICINYHFTEVKNQRVRGVYANVTLQVLPNFVLKELQYGTLTCIVRHRLLMLSF